MSELQALKSLRSGTPERDILERFIRDLGVSFDVDMGKCVVNIDIVF